MQISLHPLHICDSEQVGSFTAMFGTELGRQLQAYAAPALSLSQSFRHANLKSPCGAAGACAGGGRWPGHLAATTMKVSLSLSLSLSLSVCVCVCVCV